MVEYVDYKDKKPKVLNNKQRTHLILFTYILNFLLYIILFDKYNNWILKYLTLFLIISFALQMLSQQTNIGSINGWTIVYSIINGFAFGFTSMIFSYNLIVIMINLLYFKYIVKRIDLDK